MVTLLGTSLNAPTIGGAVDVAISEANAAHNIVANGSYGNQAIESDLGQVKAITDGLVQTAGKLWVLNEAGNPVASATAVSALPTAAQVVTAMAAHVAEGAYTWDNIMRLVLAAEGAKVSGGGTTTVTIRDASDTKDRVVATVDPATGNRTAVTLDLS